ncbi:MAG: hypothetical protein R2748_16425 [Bryobacterales bacterium]
MEARLQTLNRREAVDALLRAIDRSDLHAMERQTSILRHCLEPSPHANSFDKERTDALSGLVEEIEGSLRRMRRTASGEMARIRGAAPLLEHVVQEGRRRLTEH